MVALADDVTDPTHYLIIQRCGAELYWEFDDQRNGVYAGVNQVALGSSLLSLQIDQDVARHLNLPPDLGIDLAIEATVWADLRASLRVITDSIIPFEDT